MRARAHTHTHTHTHTRKRAQYDARRRASPDPEVRPLIERSVAEGGVLAKVFGGKPPK